MGKMKKKEELFSSSGMTHSSQFYNNTADIGQIRFNDSTSATEDVEEYIIFEENP